MHAAYSCCRRTEGLTANSPADSALLLYQFFPGSKCSWKMQTFLLVSARRGRSSVGRASASQAEGRGFEPLCPLQLIPRTYNKITFFSIRGECHSKP